ncbi:MAG: aminopeptidase N [Stackebrandtia sp.]
MPNLTHAEAIEREQLLTVDSYDVDLDFTQGSEVFGSVSTIRFSSVNSSAPTFFEVVPKRLRKVVLNGVELSTDLLKDGRFPLPELGAENVLTVEADMEYSHDGEGLHRFVDPEDGLTYTYAMTFLNMAPRVFACFDQSDLKASFRLAVTAPPEWTVVSNESGIATSPGRWEFAPTEPLATYFFTVVAGPYYSVYRVHDGVRFGLHARQSYREALDQDAEEIFDVTFGCWDKLHELYGVRYAYGDTYDQCFVPEFNAGAMENPGCVTFRDEGYMYRSAVTETRRERRSVTIAHEMAHMWFGDLVTMRWWDDLWLNESFADCMGVRGAAEGTRFRNARATDTIEAMWGYEADQRPSTHPVSDVVAASGEALNNFDGISYAKGGAILNQLAAWVGDKAFFAGLREYFGKHRHGNASLSDLTDALAASSGRDLDDWAARWLRTTGPNTLRVEVEVQDGKYVGAAVTQSAPAEHPTLRPHHVRLGLYSLTGGTAVRTGQVTVDVDGERTEVPELIDMAPPDLLLVNDENLTYAKARLDPASFEALPRVMPNLPDPLARAVLWNMLTDMVRDGELPMWRYFDLLDAALPAESQVPQLERQLLSVREAVDFYLPAHERESGLLRLNALSRRIRETSQPGGGAQLAALRREISGAISDEEIEFLRGLLAGQGVPDGITVDDELRWTILKRLVVLGKASDADVDAELERDPSSEGHKHAATCRASRPDAEAKAKAWETVMTDKTLSNHLLKATADGFWQPEQAELTADYVEKFFVDAPAHIDGRAPWETKILGRTMFPKHAIDDRTLSLADDLLAREDLSPHLRRELVDEQDDLRRALRVRGGLTASRGATIGAWELLGSERRRPTASASASWAARSTPFTTAICAPPARRPTVSGSTKWCSCPRAGPGRRPTRR